MIEVQSDNRWNVWRTYRADELRREGLNGEWAAEHAKLEARCRAAIEADLGPTMARRAPLGFAFDHVSRSLKCVPGAGAGPVVRDIVSRIGGGTTS